VKYFNWDPDKNEWLKSERSVSFEQVVFQIASGSLLDVIEHPNPARYKGQRIFIVQIGDYAYLVPFVESSNEIFLKTIIPSRKATQRYLKGE
jgi:uncharacterized DUF497 family protein